MLRGRGKGIPTPYPRLQATQTIPKEAFPSLPLDPAHTHSRKSTTALFPSLMNWGVGLSAGGFTVPNTQRLLMNPGTKLESIQGWIMLQSSRVARPMLQLEFGGYFQPILSPRKSCLAHGSLYAVYIDRFELTLAP